MLCRERFRIKAFLGLVEDQGFDEKMEFGSMCHAGLEHVSEEGYHVNGTANAVKKYCDRLCDRWPNDVDDIKFWMFAAIACVRMHHERWHTQDSRFEWVGVEHKFREQYKLPSGRTVLLRGMMDGVIRRKGKLWLKENKCKGMIDEVALQQTLHKNFQVVFYTNVLRMLFPDEEIGGVLYDVIKRPYQTIRQTKSESRDNYGQRGIEKMKADPQQHFFRWEVALTQADLDEARDTIFHPVLEQFLNWHEWVAAEPDNPFREGNEVHYMRPFGLFDAHDWGNRGAYFDLMTTGSTVMLTEAQTLFPELEE